MSNSWNVKKHVGKQFSLGSIFLAPKLFGTFPTMIETDFFILTGEQYQEFYIEAQQVGMNIDRYLMEFCDVEGPDVYVD
jgi:hypothetical protein